MTAPLPPGFEGLERFRGTTSVLDGDGEAPRPTEAELARNDVAPGTAALLPMGLVYQAGWEPLGDGIARHARAAARALARAGIPVALQSLPTSRMMLDHEIDEGVRREVHALRRTSVSSAPVAVRQLILHNHRYLENVVAPPSARLVDFETEMRVYESTIVYTSWERTTIHPETVEVLNRAGGVWVPCRMNEAVFRRNGVGKVWRIPCPFDPETSPTAGIPAPRGSEAVPPGKRFYAIGKWEPRKNYNSLIGAFLLEFAPSEPVSLFLKTHEWGAWTGYPSIDGSLREWFSDPRVLEKGWRAEKHLGSRVRVHSERVPESFITRVHETQNIYVTASHGEAWDLPAFDARVAGNRLVFTGWGGAEDYAGERDVRIVECDVPPTLPAHADYGWESQATYMDVTMEELRRALRKAEPPERRIQPPELYRDFGSVRVGEMMKESLETWHGAALEGLLRLGGFG